MRLLLPCLALAAALALPAAHAQTPAWTGGVQTTNPAPTNDTGAEGEELALDAAGNSYVSGYLQASNGSAGPAVRAFGSTTLTSTGLGSGFIAKLSPALQWQWAVRVSTSGPEGPELDELVVSPAGEVYVSGYTEEAGATTLSIGSFNQSIPTGRGFFVVRLNTSGQVQNLTLLSIPISSLRTFIEAQMAWDAVSGALAVTGNYKGLTPVLGATTLPAAPPGGAGFVARLSPAGQWSNVMAITPTGTTDDSDFGVGYPTVGPQGQMAVFVGVSNGSVSLGSADLMLSSPNTSDASVKIGVAQLSPAGQWQWLAQPAGVIEDFGFDKLGYDRAGNVWMLGGGEAGLQLGSFTLPANAEGFVARLSPTGQWGTVGTVLRPTGIPAFGYLTNMAVDAAGNAVVTGEVQPGGSLTLGTLTVSGTATSTGRNFVARFSSAGQWQYAQLTPNSTTNNTYYLNSVALDATGNLLTTGSLRNQISVPFGPNTLTGSQGGDVFVARLGNAGALSARQPAGAQRLALFPNPVAAGRAATLRLPAPTKAALPVRLRDALGRTVRAATLPAGQQQLSLPTAGLAPGLYQLEAGLSRAQIVIE